MNNNYLLDEDFLIKLQTHRHRIMYARITALTFQEDPIERIEGRITGGSISVDGDSALRRTCSVQLVANELNINEFYWGLKNKISVEIGLENTIDNHYPDIVWLPQGVYVLTAFSTSYSTNSWNISISGKDKMCLLNGDIGGSLPASIDFGKKEYYDKETNMTTYELVPIKEIIKESVHTYAKEPYHNIIINDLDEIALELLQYKGDEPLYLFRNIAMDQYTNYTLNGQTMFGDTKLEDLTKEDLDWHSNSTNTTQHKPKEAELGKARYTVSKFEKGEPVGYRLTELTYSGDLISSIGESLTSILDKIVKMLGAYEYFYNLKGQFVFQRKKTHLQQMWNGIKNQDYEQYAINLEGNDKLAFNFNDATLITAFSNNPNLAEIRNDYSVWGERTSATGTTLSIHYRFAIDEKPTNYTSFQVSEMMITQSGLDKVKPRLYATTYTVNDGDDIWREETNLDNYAASRYYYLDEWDSKSHYVLSKDKEPAVGRKYFYPVKLCGLDWREIIYQMAWDFYQYGQLDEFLPLVANANKDWCESGYTGYEQYYLDLEGFWRSMYNFAPDPVYEIAGPNAAADLYVKGLYKLDGKIYKLDTQDTNYYQVNDLDESTKAIYRNNLGYKEYINSDDLANRSKITYYTKAYPKNYWLVDVATDPTSLDFWFDFAEDGGELGQFSVKTIGDRTKAINDTTITSIYFRETPDLIFTSFNDWANSNLKFESAYTPVMVNNSIINLFSIAQQGKSAQDVIDDLVYQHSYCTENISLTTIPIYTLNPNTRIRVYDKNSKIDGEYIMTKFTLPLAYNGTMSITANKAPTLVSSK